MIQLSYKIWGGWVQKSISSETRSFYRLFYAKEGKVASLEKSDGNF